MKKILLIHAYSGGYKAVNQNYPLGLLSMATLLRENGFSVAIMDSYEFLENHAQILRDDFIYIGLSVMTPQIAMALKITRLIKKTAPGIKVVWGGVHPTLFPEQTINNELIDTIVIGEGEVPSLELARHLSDKSDISQVNGICYKSQGQILKTQGSQAFDINKEPFLNYDIPNASSYIYAYHDFSDRGGPRNVRSVEMITGRGCPYQCTFCINNTSLRKKFRFKSAARILDEIEFYQDKYKIECVRFQDEEFFVSKQRIFEFLDGIEKRNIKIIWIADVRANHFVDNYITDELAARIKASGCCYWTIGVESASKRILEKLKKYITVEQVIRARDVSKKAGINIGYGFMIGIPGETKKDIVDALRLADKLKNKNSREIIFSVFRPYPGSELYDEALKLGIKEFRTLEEWEDGNFYETLFRDVDDYPWVEDKKFIRLIKFTANNVFSNYKRAYQWLGWTRALKLIGTLRIKLNFWGFPAEYVLFNLMRRLVKIKNTHAK